MYLIFESTAYDLGGWQIEWLKEERESIQQQLDAARGEVARKESYNAVELEKMVLRPAEVRSEVSRHEAVQEQMKMEREEESLQLRIMLQRERAEKETLMKQRDDMLFQLNATTGIIETLRSQLAEAAVSLARNEEERKARLRSQQPRPFPAPEAGSSVDVKIEQQVLIVREDALFQLMVLDILCMSTRKSG